MQGEGDDACARMHKESERVHDSKGMTRLARNRTFMRATMHAWIRAHFTEKNGHDRKDKKCVKYPESLALSLPSSPSSTSPCPTVPQLSRCVLHHVPVLSFCTLPHTCLTHSHLTNACTRPHRSPLLSLAIALLPFTNT